MSFFVFFLVGAHASIQVEIKGLSDSQATNVRAYLSIVKVARRIDDSAASLSEFTVSRLHGKADSEIKNALMPFGYYSPQITPSLENKEGNWIARYEVDKGLPTLIKEVDVQVEDAVRQKLSLDKLLARTNVKSGQVLNHKSYTELKQALLRNALAQGYLDATYSRSELRVAPETRAASIHLHLNQGERFFFGPVTLEQDVLEQSFAERYIAVKAGEPFSTEELVNTQFVLSDSGYYEKVAVNAPRDAAVDQQIPVTVRAESYKSRRYLARAGVGTDTGPRLRLGTEFRRLNRRGAKFRSDIQVSNITSTATAQFSFPIKNVATDRQTFSGSFDRAEIGDTDSDLYSLGARRYDRWKGLGRQLYLEFENELFSLDGVDDIRSELLILGGSLAYQKVDDAIFTRRGVTARLDIHGAYEGLLTDTSFLQASLATRAILPLGDKARLLMRADVGFTEVDNLASLPPSQRFFTGGDRTVRGYGFEQLSPEDADGRDVGGRYLLAASIEADYFFNDKYGAAVFFDHGNAVNSLQDALKSSVGVGFRLRTPVGVLRIDGARPFDQSEDSFRIHVSLGPDT
ncbi:MAG: autotransporter assembly complex family protein [Gammaproteobacteria bacterium]